jgi:hypothetical protein
MTKVLTIATHDRRSAYWEGGHYELNVSFDTLRDKQWQRVMQAIWEYKSVYGPLASRYTPGSAPADLIASQTPPPTATLTQYGQMKIGTLVVGCDVQATRSLFECISILIPIGMFDGITGESGMRKQHDELSAVDEVLIQLAMTIYDAAPFKIAAIGYERECQLPAELRSNAEMLKAFLADGNALVQEEVLRTLHQDVSNYDQVRANLRWLPPGDA